LSLLLLVPCVLWLFLNGNPSTITTSQLIIMKEYPSVSPIWDWSVKDFNIEDILATVPSDRQTYCRNILTAQKDIPVEQLWSQAYQDWYVYHNFFQGKTDGVYVDMGAHVPFKFSNTAFFDVCLGWKGICVEPSYHSVEFETNRSCTVAKHCMHSTSGPLIMTNGEDVSFVIGKETEVVETNNTFKCDGISARDLFNRYLPKDKFGELIDTRTKNNDSNNSNDNNKKKKIEIDFISLDVEGSEVPVLECFPFDLYQVKVWAIEINKNEMEIDELMLAYGYIKESHLTYFSNRLDAVYVWKPRKMANPWSDGDSVVWKRHARCTQN